MDRNLDDVAVFARVVEAGSFTKAAKALGVPVSTVSRKVSRLEDDLKVRLLQRTTRKLSLTEPGRLYYERVSRSLAELDCAEKMLQEIQETPRGVLRMTAPVEPTVVIDLVVEFLREYSEVRVEIDFTNRVVDLIEEGYDLAVRAGRLPDSSLIAHKLGEGQLHIVASPGYINRRGLPESVEDIKEHCCVLMGRSVMNPSWSLHNKAGKKVTVPVNARLVVNHLEAVRDAALAGLGLALLPEVYCDDEIEDGRLVHVLPELSLDAGAMWVVYPSRQHLAPTVRAFVDFAKANAGRVLPRRRS
jgi:DNA-binding transcriptional LysR family regulator